MSELFIDQKNGPADSRRIVFVHGAMDRSTSFARVRQRFSNNTTIAYDRRGYAKSLGIGPAKSFRDHVTDLHSVLVGSVPSPSLLSDGLLSDSLPSDGLLSPSLLRDGVLADMSDGRAVLVGHSYGGVVCLAAAAEFPELVSALVVFEAPMPWEPWWPGNAGGSTIAIGESQGPAAAAEAFMRRIVGDQIWERIGERTRADRRAEGEALLFDLAGLRGVGCPYDLNAVKCPAVVGHGELSQDHQIQSAVVLHSRLHSVFGERGLGDGGVVLRSIEGARHGAHAANAEAFGALVEEALNMAGSG
jgi:pimeloyl-ACP methyl ester carboxylesterase